MKGGGRKRERVKERERQADRQTETETELLVFSSILTPAMATAVKTYFYFIASTSRHHYKPVENLKEPPTFYYEHLSTK